MNLLNVVVWVLLEENKRNDLSCRILISGLLIFDSQYQLALFQIDSMRKDGKFVGVDGSIPEGQGIVMAHLNECHELLEMVRHPTLYICN